jgi:putative SOS response-associated peptidase YedK
MGQRLINARAETVAEKPAFRDAFRRRRCLIPADGFYEWKAVDKGKQPYYISLRSGEPMALGGLWESWRGADGSVLRTCAIVTTGPNGLMASIHERMPLIIALNSGKPGSKAQRRLRSPCYRPTRPSPCRPGPCMRA